MALNCAERSSSAAGPSSTPRGDDRLGCPVRLWFTHRSQPVFQPTVVGLDRIVRVPLDVVPCLPDQLVEHPG
jgi:hypothetical protein